MALIVIRQIIQSSENKITATIVIRNLDDEVEYPLRVRAANSGRSMEEEVCQILRHAVGPKKLSGNLAKAIRARVAHLGDVDLGIPSRAIPVANCPHLNKTT